MCPIRTHTKKGVTAHQLEVKVHPSTVPRFFTHPLTKVKKGFSLILLYFFFYISYINLINQPLKILILNKTLANLGTEFVPSLDREFEPLNTDTHGGFFGC